MTPRLARLAFLPAALLAAALVWRFDATGDPAAAVPAPAGTDSEMHFTLGERALLDCLNCQTGRCYPLSRISRNASARNVVLSRQPFAG